MNALIENEIEISRSEGFKLGEFIYMGMAKVQEKRVCISVAYKIDYCIKKAQQFAEADENVKFTHINKVKIGELMRCQKFELN